MMSVYRIVLASAMLALPAAAMLGGQTGQGVTIHQELMSRTQMSSPLDRMLSTYYKHGVKPPEGLVHAANGQNGSAGTVGTTYDGFYTVPVTLGEQTMHIVVNTGSSDLWVYSTLLPANETAGRSVVYDPDHSSTAKLMSGSSWNFPSSSPALVKGVVYADKVTIGGVTATSQAVEAATTVLAPQDFTTRDGFLGLGFTKYNNIQPAKQKTFFETVRPTLQQKLFTLDLIHNGNGSLDFGYIDSSKYSGDIAYAPVNVSDGNWAFRPQGFKIGGGSKIYSTQQAATVDSSGSLIWIPSDVATAYYAQVPQSSQGSPFYTFPCNATLPDFSIAIEGADIKVPGHYINDAPMPGKGGFCIGALQSSSGYTTSILGTAFIKSVFAVFDETQDQPRLGFAEKALA